MPRGSWKNLRPTKVRNEYGVKNNAVGVSIIKGTLSVSQLGHVVV
jgi:hypothetical protein